MDEHAVDEIVAEFLVEAHEGLDGLDRDLVALEGHPSPDLVGSIFRTVHSIKGTCGFFGFDRLESLAHVAENLLSLVRDGKLEVTTEITTALLETVDAIRAMLEAIEQTGSDGESDHASLIERLTRLQATEPVVAVPRLGDLLIERSQATKEDIEAAIALQAAGDDRPLGVILVDQGVVKAEDVEAALSAQSDRRGVAMADSTIRVDVRVLDDVMQLADELASVRDQIVRLAATDTTGMFDTSAERLDVITASIRDAVMRARVQPIGNVWNRFHRLVRDLAHTTGKQVRIEMEGATTELDKAVVEAIKDPLTHLVRNAVDHGIELPEVRRERGKPEEGRIALRAVRDDAAVTIEITDDGAGIDVDQIRARALERGLIGLAQASSMSDDDLISLIFLPGFSTTTTITNLSGRGVGMDVVATNIERIGGTFEVSSELGAGTTVRVSIPLAVEIVSGLALECGGHRFVVPKAKVDDVVTIDVRTRPADPSERRTVVDLDGTLVPVAELAALLELDDLARCPGPGGPGRIDVLVVTVHGERIGLAVESVGAVEEVVVKPPTERAESGIVVGSAVLADGSVATVLDIEHLDTSQAGARTTAETAEVERIVVDVWSTMLGLEAAACETDEGPVEQTVRARVRLAGGWSGAVDIMCDAAAAGRFTTAMMCDEAPPTDEDVADVLGELANIVGGNVKAALGLDGDLSTAEVSNGCGADRGDRADRSIELLRQPFVTSSGAFSVVVHQRVVSDC